jgi:AdoMet-dependent heme synthase
MPSIDEFYFQWHLTERCNKSCRHCYQTDHLSTELPLDQLKLILHGMDDALTKWGLSGSLSLTGGEPFVRRAELFALMHVIDELESFTYYDILSNGSLISSDDVMELSVLRKLRRVQLSLEGATRSTNDLMRGCGTFEETLDAIRLLKHGGLTVGVMTTLSRLNSGEVPDLISMLDELGVDTFAMERLIPEGSGTELRDQLLLPCELRDLYSQVYDLARSTRHLRVLLHRPLLVLTAPNDPTVGALCSVGNNALTVMPDGTVYPCRRLPIPIGNALVDGFFSIWYGSEVLWRIRDPGNYAVKCRGCQFFAACRGCRAMAHFSSGDYMGDDPQCWN